MQSIISTAEKPLKAAGPPHNPVKKENPAPVLALGVSVQSECSSEGVLIPRATALIEHITAITQTLAFVFHGATSVDREDNPTGDTMSRVSDEPTPADREVSHVL
jgi:hypothetical protein